MAAYIDKYCERLEPGLWAEPLNALTNLSFIVAAFFAWRLGESTGRNSASAIVLMALMVAIGIGSGLFHTVRPSGPGSRMSRRSRSTR